jgi:hypothetical protein
VVGVGTTGGTAVAVGGAAVGEPDVLGVAVAVDGPGVAGVGGAGFVGVAGAEPVGVGVWPPGFGGAGWHCTPLTVQANGGAAPPVTSKVNDTVAPDAISVSWPMLRAVTNWPVEASRAPAEPVIRASAGRMKATRQSRIVVEVLLVIAYVAWYPVPLVIVVNVVVTPSAAYADSAANPPASRNEAVSPIVTVHRILTMPASLVAP